MRQVLVAHSTVHDGSMLNRDNPHDERVIANRRQWLSSVGADIENTYRVCLTFQDDGDYCRYREVSPSDAPASKYDLDNKPADALITTKVGQALFLPLADCVGVVLFDEVHGVLMLTHLGRHSLEQDGGVRSVEYLVEHYRSAPHQLKVWLTAAVGKQTYKIFALDGKGLKEVLFEQLKRAGVDLARIQDTPHDTATHPDYYSHSEFLKGNKTDSGRHAIVAMMTVEATVKMV